MREPNKWREPIVNGRIANDSCGNLTFRIISRIDYFLCSPSLFQQIHNLEVNLLNPMISDGHCIFQYRKLKIYLL